MTDDIKPKSIYAKIAMTCISDICALSKAGSAFDCLNMRTVL